MNYEALPNDMFLPYMKENRLLLCKIYKASKSGDTKVVRSLILHATDGELRILLEVLRRIAVREIGLSKEGSEKVVRSRRAALLRRLAVARKYEEISTLPRLDLVKYLSNFNALYVHLFHYLFNH